MLTILNIPTFYAQISTGNTTAQSFVQTDIQGSGNVSTHIEVSANGEKKTLDANSPGTYSLSVRSNSNNNNQETTPAATPTLSPKPSIMLNDLIATPTAAIKTEQKHETTKPSFFSNLATYIKNFLAPLGSLFSNLSHKI